MKNFKIGILFLLVAFVAMTTSVTVHFGSVREALAQSGLLQAGQLWGNPSGSAAPSSPTTVGALVDQEYTCTAQGSIIYRGGSLWTCLAPGTSGLPLLSQGPSANLHYALMPLASLVTGTQDTAIGYWGSTTPSALAINNCTNSLTYSTSTHTFGCNTGGGTGSVTSVTCGTGLSGGTFTATGTCAVNLSALTNSIGTTAVANGSFTLGPNVAQGASGTWFASGTITLTSSNGSPTIGTCKLWDGVASVIASSSALVGASVSYQPIALSGYLASPAGGIRISCQSNSTGMSMSGTDAAGSVNGSTLSVFRIQ